MGSRSKNSTTKDDDDNKDDAGTVIAFAAAAAGAMALGSWGISKWLGSSEEPQPKRQEQIMMPSSSSRLTNIYNDQTSYVGNTAFTYEGAVKNLKWKKPKAGWDKLNIDGGARKQQYKTTGPARAGGLIRHDDGSWVVGFTAELQDCDGVSAELEAIRYGLLVAARQVEYKFKDLEVETDCDEAVRLIYNRSLDLERHYCGSVVRGCRELLKELGVEILIVDRSQNKCADGLAKVPIPQGKFHVWDEVSDLPRTHYKNFNDLYLAERASY